MLVPVFNVNLGIKKHQQLCSSFCTLIQNEPDNTAFELNVDHDEADEDICVALNGVDTETRIRILLKVEYLIKENKYVENELENFKQDVKKISTSSSLSRDKVEFIPHP